MKKGKVGMILMLESNFMSGDYMVKDAFDGQEIIHTPENLHQGGQIAIESSHNLDSHYAFNLSFDQCRFSPNT